MDFQKTMLGENSKQLSLNLDSIMNDVSKVDDLLDKRSILNLHLKSLKEEMGKVESVKSELPYCMDLIKHAFERLREELKAIERLIGESKESKVTNEDGVGVSNDETKEWMKSWTLWSTPTEYDTNNNLEPNAQDSFLKQRSGYEVEKGSGSSGKSLGCNLKSGGEAFVPCKNSPDGVALKAEKMVAPVQGLSFQVPVVEVEQQSVELNVHEERTVDRRQRHEPEDQPRKMRRCWSPELHQLFVDALNQLGGEEKATPKQIRELMNVEGLTSDEVKSHLQKYRIHIRKFRA